MAVVSIIAIATLGRVSAFGQAVSPDNTNIKWHTGRKLDQFNKLAISVWWKDAEIRDRVELFSQRQEIAVFLDRRIDPSTPVQLTIENCTKEQFLWALAKQSDLGICRIEDFYYFGPVKTAASLPTVLRQLRQSTTAKKRSKVDWNDDQPLKTESVVEPKKILLQLAKANRFAIRNLDSVPHDLWAGIDLPNSSLNVRVGILLVGFGKTFQRNDDGDIITIVDFPELDSTEASFRDLDNALELSRKLRPKFPQLKISAKGKKRIDVSGPPTQVSAIGHLIVAAQRPIGVDGGESTFTLTTRAARGAVLATAAARSNIVLDFDKTNRQLVTSLNEPVEINAVNATLAELLQLALDGTNLKYEIGSGVLKITER